jgi:hypothetical protein
LGDSAVASIQGGKQKEGSRGRGGVQEKSGAFLQPIKTPQKSKDTNYSEDDGFSFCNMMGMMMYKSQLEAG